MSLNVQTCKTTHLAFVSGGPLAECVVTSSREDTGVCVCTRIAVIAGAASRRSATAGCVTEYARRAYIIFCTHLIVIARPSLDKSSPASEVRWVVDIVGVVLNFSAHVPVSAAVEVVAGLICCQGAAAASTGVKRIAGGYCHTLIVDAAFVVVIANIPNGDVSLAHWNVSFRC
jgi:hypothetical protein